MLTNAIKRALLCAVIFSVFTSCRCQPKDVYKHTIQDIDIYPEKEKNEKIAHDLQYHRFADALLKELAALSKEDFQSIKLKYSSHPEASKVTYYIELDLKNAKVAKYKSQITEYFDRTIKSKIAYRAANEDLFNKAEQSAKLFYQSIDQLDIEGMMNMASDAIRNERSQEDTKRMIENFQSSYGPLQSRESFSIAHYNSIGPLRGNIFAVTFKSTFKYKSCHQGVTLNNLSDGKWQVVGYQLCLS